MRVAMLLFVASFLLYGCGVAAPVTLTETDDFKSLKKKYVEPIRYKVAVAPVNIAAQTGPQGENAFAFKPDADRLQGEIVAALKQLPAFSAVEVLAKKDLNPKDPISVAAERGLDAVFTATVRKCTVSFVGTNSNFTAVVITWLFSPLASWAIADETYSAEMLVDVALTSVEDGKQLWAKSVVTKVQCDLSDFQRGVKWLRFLPSPGVMGESNWQAAMDTLTPHLEQKFQIDLMANILAEVPQPPPPKRSFAIVVGINKYSDSTLPAPKFASNDADVFAQILSKKENGYFKVSLLKENDATTANIEKEIDAIAKEKYVEVVNILFYFAGLGATELKPDGTAVQYLLTADSDVKDRTALLSLERLGELLNGVKAQARIVILDTGFFEGQGRTVGLIGESKDVTLSFSQKFLSTDGLTFLSACQPNETAAELESLSHGVFSSSVIDGLSGKADVNADKMVTAEELFGTISWVVTREARVHGDVSQQPFFAGNKDAVIVGPLLGK